VPPETDAEFRDQALEPVPAATEDTTPDLVGTAGGASGEDEWRERALQAEQRAENALAIVRQGVAPYLARFLVNKVLGHLVRQRAELVRTQDVGADRLREVEDRLLKIHEQFQWRVASYEQRIAELEQEVETKNRENQRLQRGRRSLAEHVLAEEPRQESSRVNLRAAGSLVRA
jgi:hypothetical protein